jgi:peroxiredoxin
MIGSFRRVLMLNLFRLTGPPGYRMNTYAGRMNFMPRDGFRPAQSRLKMDAMTTPSLSERLDYLRGASPKWRERYDELVARLRALEVGARAPSVGDRFPEIVLPDHRGRYRTLTSLLADGPLVVSFNRGSWCPYCVSELESWRAALPGLRQVGGKLAIVTAELGGRSRALGDIAGPGSVTLCDVDYGVTLELGLAFHVGSTLVAAYREFGIDLNELYGGTAGLLPVPATFVVRTDGLVDYAFVEPDFRLRAEPEDVVRIVASLIR